MSLVSYAQNREDVVLARAFGDRARGFYIDIGAWHPVLDSVTCFFYRQGWRGVNVEPLAAYLELLRQERPEDVNLGLGIARQRGEGTFYEDLTAPGLSTFSPAQAAKLRSEGHQLREHRQAVVSLAELCAEHAPGEIDFLKIDVEGGECEAIIGGDWRRWRPRVVLVEATAPGSYTTVHQEWEGLLLGADYLFALFDGLNRFYVRAEDRGLLAALDRPACVLDDFVPYEHLLRLDELRQRAAELEGGLHEQQQVAGRYLESLRRSLEQKEAEIRGLLAEAERHEAEARRFSESLQASLAEKERELEELAVRIARMTPS